MDRETESQSLKIEGKHNLGIDNEFQKEFETQKVVHKSEESNSSGSLKKKALESVSSRKDCIPIFKVFNPSS